MRVRTLFSAVAVLAFIAAASLTARGDSATLTVCCVESHSCCVGGVQSCCASKTTRWAIVNFADPVIVNKAFVSGPVLIVHDDEKMARGEPCTTFYRFDAAAGAKETLASFHCKPRRGKAAAKTTLTTAVDELGVKRLVEYQIAGETEAHGVPR